MFGNYLSFDCMNVSSETIKKKIKNKESIESFLDDEDLLQEIRVQNEDLINYFDEDKIKKLIDFIIVEPKESDGDKRCKSYPFASSQLFALEEPKIMDYFFKSEKELKEDKEKKEKERKEKEEKEKKEEEEKKAKEKQDVNNSNNNTNNTNNNTNNNNNNTDNKVEASKDEKKDSATSAVPTANVNDVKEKKNDDNQNENEKNKNFKLFDYFLSFLSPDINLNYVLCGYFESLMNNLLAMKPSIIVSYLYTKKADILDRMVRHSYRKSIAQTLSKLLQFENYFKSEESTVCSVNEVELDKAKKEKMVEIREQILLKIFQRINIDMDNEELNSMFFLIEELLESKIIYKLIVENKDIIKCLITDPFTEINKEQLIDDKRKTNIILIIDIVNICLKNFKKSGLETVNTFYEMGDEENSKNENNKNTSTTTPTITNNEETKNVIYHNEINGALFSVINKLIEVNFNKNNKNSNNNDKELLESYDERIIPLGVHRIKIVELLYNLMDYCKDISKQYDEVLIKTKFFENAFDYLYEYQWNNLYQDALLVLLRKFLSNSATHDILANFLFNNLKLINKIKDGLKDEILNYKRIPLDANVTGENHGYKAFFISLSYKLNAIIGGNLLKINDNTTNEGNITFMNKLPNATENERKEAYNLLNSGNENEGIITHDDDKRDDDFKGAVESMKKFVNDDWKNYFDQNLAGEIKLYESKLCDEKPKPTESKDIFDVLFSGNKKNFFQTETTNNIDNNTTNNNSTNTDNNNNNFTYNNNNFINNDFFSSNNDNNNNFGGFSNDSNKEIDFKEVKDFDFSNNDQDKNKEKAKKEDDDKTQDKNKNLTHEDKDIVNQMDIEDNNEGKKK